MERTFVLLFFSIIIKKYLIFKNNFLIILIKITKVTSNNFNQLIVIFLNCFKF